MPSNPLRVAILALASPSRGFVATWRAYGMDPYTYTWQMPLEPNSTTGLGGGIVYAMGQGELTKFVPVGASSLAMLSDAGAREGLFQDSLLSGLHAGLGNDENGQLV